MAKDNEKNVVIIGGHRYYERPYVPGFPRMKELIRCKDRLKSSKNKSLTFKPDKERNSLISIADFLDNHEKVYKPVERAAVPVLDPKTFDWQNSLGQKSLPREQESMGLSFPMAFENIVLP